MSEVKLAPPMMAGLVVVNPSGNRRRVALDPLPFQIGRQAGNQLVLRDNRISRSHARFFQEDGGYFVEDLNSRHGVFVNGVKVTRARLANCDRIDFGLAESYRLIFTVQEDELDRILGQIQAPAQAAGPGTGNLVKLRALVEVARALQTSLSTDDVLSAVIDAALAVTGSERGFLFLRESDELVIKVARDRSRSPLPVTDLKVSASVLKRALESRRELFSMSFDALRDLGPNATLAAQDLRSVVCLPLVKVRTGSTDETMMATVSDTAGLIYMDSRLAPADLSSGNRELLQTLALEASTILENARLLEEERSKQRIEEELNVAREIQQSLLPKALPTKGWFRAAGSSRSSHEVGGDYFDIRALNPGAWSTVIADVSGKGVSSALLASLLQGAFLLGSESDLPIPAMMARINHFLNIRTQGEKYATVFYSVLDRDGTLQWANAGHPPPLVVSARGGVRELNSTGLPLGMLQEAVYTSNETQLEPGDAIVLYSDGLSEARNEEGQHFGEAAIRKIIAGSRAGSCGEIHQALLDAAEAFTEGSVLEDDMTLVVVEYQP
jgi:serine phosphatase RsbU (regulator of sigma subunit)